MPDRNVLLIVDDMEVNRVILNEIFSDTYTVLQAENGIEAVSLIEDNKDTLAVILLDIIMPKMNGYEVMDFMMAKGYTQFIPVVVITAHKDSENEVHCLELGAVDMIEKPFEPHIVKRRVMNVVDTQRYREQLETRVIRQQKRLDKSYETMVGTLSSIVEHRNMESGQHLIRIRKLTKLMLEKACSLYSDINYTQDEINMIAYASLLHDVGKIVIPDAILNKPSRLTDEEYEIMKTHSVRGCEIITRFSETSGQKLLGYAYGICRHHHERWDGHGYPDGLIGDEIPFYAQVVGIADAYDALTNQRVYKPALPHETAVNMIVNGECGAFSPRILECFKAISQLFYATEQESLDETEDTTNQIVSGLAEAFNKDSCENTRVIYDSSFRTLLKYMNNTVVEIDFETDSFNRLFPAYSEFGRDESVGNVDAMVEFIGTTTHPDDRENARIVLDYAKRQILSGNYVCTFDDFRLYNKVNNKYQWYEVSFISLDSEKSKKGIIIFKNIESRRELENKYNLAEERLVFLENTALSASSANSENKLQSTRDMLYIQAMMDYFGGMLLEYDLITGECRATRKYEEVFGMTFPQTVGSLPIICSESIHPDDYPRYMEHFSRQLKGEKVEAIEVRVKMRSGNYEWHSKRSMVVCDEQGKPIKSLSVLINVDNSMTDCDKSYKLENVDVLTGIYSQNKLQSKIDEYIKQNPKEKHALISIDLDNFAQVNEKVGHRAGDRILREFSSAIVSMFSDNAVYGRVGGDEFVILMKNIGDTTFVESEAARLQNSLIHFEPGANKFNTITVSMGISVYPENGCNYEQLLSTANKSLYAAKNLGKNQLRFVSESDEKLVELKKIQRNSTPVEGSIGEEISFNKLIAHLGQNRANPENGIKKAIDLVARHYMLSGVIVSTYEASGLNIFSWFENTGTNSALSKSVNVRLIKDFITQRLDDDVFVYNENDSSIPQYIKEVFTKTGAVSSIGCFFALDDEKEPFGSVFFEDSNIARNWSKQEKEALKEISYLCSNMYSYRKMAASNSRNLKLVHQLIEMIPQQTHVVDEYFHILDCNTALAIEINAPIHIGSKCYEMYGKTAPCSFCPIKSVDGNQNELVNVGANSEMYANKIWKAKSVKLDDNRKLYIVTTE